MHALIALSLTWSVVGASPTPVPDLVKQLPTCKSLERCKPVLELIKRGPSIWPAVQVGLTDGKEMIRFWTLGVLSEVVIPQAREAISERLTDKEIRVRAAAAFALGAQGSHAVTGALLKALMDDDLNVRFAAAVSLEKIRDPASVDGLIKACRDADEEVRAHAALALGSIGDRRAGEALLERINQDIKPIVRGYAIMALGNLGDPGHIKALIAHTHRESDDKVLAALAYAFGALKAQEALPILKKLTTYPNPEVKTYAEDAIAKITGKKPSKPAKN